jgi:Holliday junction resolvase RusA-like endonuclease
VKPAAPLRPKKYDTDKLQRALGDALTQAGLIRDDKLIADWRARKRYTTGGPGMTVRVEIDEGAE